MAGAVGSPIEGALGQEKIVISILCQVHSLPRKNSFVGAAVLNSPKKGEGGADAICFRVPVAKAIGSFQDSAAILKIFRLIPDSLAIRRLPSGSQLLRPPCAGKPDMSLQITILPGSGKGKGLPDSVIIIIRTVEQ